MRLDKNDIKHGGSLDQYVAEFPTCPQPWIDLSTGINPWPYPVITSSYHFAHLPTQKMRLDCISAMAETWRLDGKHILPVPGLELALRCLPSLIGSTSVVLRQPTYADYADNWRRTGHKVFAVDDPLDIKPMGQTFVLCNPNNPDGKCWSRQQLEDFYVKVHASGGWLMIDEAYGELQPKLSITHLAGQERLVILKSLGKFYGLPGLRLGAVIANKSLLAALDETLGQWAVSPLALEMGTKAYKDVHWQNKTRQHLAETAYKFDKGLYEAGFGNFSGCDLFKLIEVNDASIAWRHLMEAGIYSRKFDWSNKHLRLGLPGNPAAFDRTMAALRILSAEANPPPRIQPG